MGKVTGLGLAEDFVQFAWVASFYIGNCRIGRNLKQLRFNVDEWLLSEGVPVWHLT